MKKRVGIFGLSGCWGEQIVILNCEDELLDLLEYVHPADFLGASSWNDTQGPLDIAFVEGSVGSDREERLLKGIRERSTLLVACGSCACFGGVQSRVPPAEIPALANLVYGDMAGRFDMKPHRPLSAIVRVDAGLPGCPMEKGEFLRAVACLVNGDLPLPQATAVCHECQMNENECLLTRSGIPCLGSVTLAGCNARCPSHHLPCIGCRGPVEEANYESWLKILTDRGWDAEALRGRLRIFGAPVLDRGGQ